MKLFYPFTVTVNKCGGSCKTINDICTWVCVPNVVKNMNVKVFNVGGKCKKIFCSTWIIWM